MKRHQLLAALGVSISISLQCMAQTTVDSMNNEHRRYWAAHRSELKLAKGAIEIQPGEIPQKIQKTLDENALYKGWRYSPVYFDRKSNLYTLYVKKDSTITAYGFNDKGNAVTYDSYTVHEE